MCVRAPRPGGGEEEGAVLVRKVDHSRQSGRREIMVNIENFESKEYTNLLPLPGLLADFVLSFYFSPMYGISPGYW